jgi:hypothetical protein
LAKTKSGRRRAAPTSDHALGPTLTVTVRVCHCTWPTADAPALDLDGEAVLAGEAGLGDVFEIFAFADRLAVMGLARHHHDIFGDVALIVAELAGLALGDMQLVAMHFLQPNPASSYRHPASSTAAAPTKASAHVPRRVAGNRPKDCPMPRIARTLRKQVDPHGHSRFPLKFALEKGMHCMRNFSPRRVNGPGRASRVTEMSQR